MPAGRDTRTEILIVRDDGTVLLGPRGMEEKKLDSDSVGLALQAGMIFTIEPMINAGKAGTSVLSDGWTVVTKDRSLSAQWEHTVAVTDTGFDLLTPWPEGTGDYAAIV